MTPSLFWVLLVVGLIVSLPIGWRIGYRAGRRDHGEPAVTDWDEHVDQALAVVDELPAAVKHPETLTRRHPPLSNISYLRDRRDKLT